MDRVVLSVGTLNGQTRDILLVRVGLQKAEFTVLEALIRQDSPLFNAALASHWREPNGLVVKLPNEDPQLFTAYCNCVGGGVYGRQSRGIVVDEAGWTGEVADGGAVDGVDTAAAFWLVIGELFPDDRDCGSKSWVTLIRVYLLGERLGARGFVDAVLRCMERKERGAAKE